MPCASAEIPASTAGTTTEAMLIMTVMMLCTIGMTAWMAEPMICIAVIMAEPRPLMMPAIDGAAAVKVCRMMGTTVPVRKLKMSWMIGFTVVCAKLTICPTTPITDCRMFVSPSKAAPASSPNRFVMVSRNGASAFATPPSANSPVMKLPTFCSTPMNLSNTATPVSPNTFWMIPRMSSRWSPKMLTTAMMEEITPITGAAPAKMLPKPEAMGPHTVPSTPAPDFATVPRLPSTPPMAFPAPELAMPLTKPPALPSRPDRFCWMMLP